MVWFGVVWFGAVWSTMREWSIAFLSTDEGENGADSRVSIETNNEHGVPWMVSTEYLGWGKKC